MAKRSSFDFSTVLGLAVAGAGAWWLYNNWSSLYASVSTALTPSMTVAPVTLTPAQLTNIVALQAQAAVAQETANAATAAGNPNAAILQAQAQNLQLAVSEAQATQNAAAVNSTLQSTGLGWVNRVHMRRAA